MSDCLFCRIVAGEIPADVVHDDRATCWPSATSTRRRRPRPGDPAGSTTRDVAARLASPIPTLAGRSCWQMPAQVAADARARRSGYRLVLNTGATRRPDRLPRPRPRPGRPCPRPGPPAEPERRVDAWTPQNHDTEGPPSARRPQGAPMADDAQSRPRPESPVRIEHRDRRARQPRHGLACSGSGDEFLRLVERRFPEVDIMARGNEITVSAARPPRSRWSSALVDELVAVLRTGQGLTAEAVERVGRDAARADDRAPGRGADRATSCPTAAGRSGPRR